MSEAGTAVALEKEIEEKKKPKRERGKGRIFWRGEWPWIDFYDLSRSRRQESARTAIEEGRNKRKDESTDDWKLAGAVKLVEKRIGAKVNDILPPAKKSRVTVAMLYKDKLAELKPKTADWLKSRWELRLRDHFGARRALQIRLADFIAYRNERMKHYREQFPEASPKKLAACETAVNGDLAALRMMFYYGKYLGNIDIVPAFPKEFDGAPERVGTVTQEQFEAMLAACQDDEMWLKTFLTMAYTWGYRLRELLNLQCARVNLKDKTVYLPPRSTKNQQPRTVPVSEREIPLLKTCIAGKLPQDFVFTRSDGIRVRDFRARWEQIVETAKAGHAEITLEGESIWYPAIPHDLRRTAVSRMLSGGMPPESVRALVGHISEEMTGRYYKPALDTLRRLQRAAEIQMILLSTPEEVSEDRQLTNGDNSGTIQTLPDVSMS